MCTEEYRIIDFQIMGDSLTDFYTIRQSNPTDTIRIESDRSAYGANFYPVLEDNYLPKLKNSQDTFHFIGEINQVVVVNEVFVISADQCHISKVSGSKIIYLQDK
jgi:hypothetical protein